VPGAREEVVEALLAGGATTDNAISPDDDTTLLMVALDAGSPAIAAALLRAGADLSACDGQRRTALERARWREREDLVATLEALGTRRP
jgi:ankyrin repeat protein